MRVRSGAPLLGVSGIALLCAACPHTTQDLTRAVSTGDVKLAKKCIDEGVDVNRPWTYGFRSENDGGTPLTTAVESGKQEMVEFLIAHGADVNLGFGGKPDGTSPLSVASIHGRLDIAKLLIGAGARVDARDSQGLSPLAFAVSGGNFEIADVLTGAGAKPDADVFRAVLEHGAAERRIEMVRYLLGRGLDPKGADPEGVTFVARAQSKGLPEVADLLRSAGTKD